MIRAQTIREIKTMTTIINQAAVPVVVAAAAARIIKMMMMITIKVSLIRSSIAIRETLLDPCLSNNGNC